MKATSVGGPLKPSRRASSAASVSPLPARPPLPAAPPSPVPALPAPADPPPAGLPDSPLTAPAVPVTPPVAPPLPPGAPPAAAFPPVAPPLAPVALPPVAVGCPPATPPSSPVEPAAPLAPAAGAPDPPATYGGSCVVPHPPEAARTMEKGRTSANRRLRSGAVGRVTLLRATPMAEWVTLYEPAGGRTNRRASFLAPCRRLACLTHASNSSLLQLNETRSSAIIHRRSRMRVAAALQLVALGLRVSERTVGARDPPADVGVERPARLLRARAFVDAQRRGGITLKPQRADRSHRYVGRECARLNARDFEVLLFGGLPLASATQPICPQQQSSGPVASRLFVSAGLSERGLLPSAVLSAAEFEADGPCSFCWEDGAAADPRCEPSRRQPIQRPAAEHEEAPAEPHGVRAPSLASTHRSPSRRPRRSRPAPGLRPMHCGASVCSQPAQRTAGAPRRHLQRARPSHARSTDALVPVYRALL